jgi:CheY-like chemotaxis protein
MPMMQTVRHSHPEDQSSQPPALRVLVVEDHSDTAFACKSVLEKRGCQVEVTGSVAGALDCLLKHPFDLILSDVGLPDGDGAKLISCVRKFCETPAIAVTGYDAPGDVNLCHKAGFNSHLAKPIDVEKLFSTITQLTGWTAGTAG